MDYQLVIKFWRKSLADEAFLKGEIHTGYLEALLSSDLTEKLIDVVSDLYHV